MSRERRPIKIGLSDFWPGFKEESFRILHILKAHFPVTISETPEYLIYSDWGTHHTKQNCVKIHFSGENTRPNHELSDFFIGFDYSDSEEYLRYPLYVEYRDQSYNENLLEKPINTADIDSIMSKKGKFCCFIVSNGKSKFRNEFFQRLNSRCKVDSGGGFLNNMGKRVENKIEFMKDYRFAIAFENVAHGGYTTEKILQPYYSRTIPIYWGNPKVDDEFDPSSFIWIKGPDDVDSGIERILALDSDPQALREMIARSPFYGRRRNLYYSEDRVAAFFERVFSKTETRVTAAARQSARLQASARQIGKRIWNRVTK